MTDTPHDYDLLYQEMELNDMAYVTNTLRDELRELRQRVARVEQSTRRFETLVLLHLAGSVVYKVVKLLF